MQPSGLLHNAVYPDKLMTPENTLPASVVYDVMKRRGLERCVLPPTIRPLAPQHRICGRAFTISGHENASLSAHETLLRWSELLSRIPRDSVAVCQPNTRAIALMGELSARALAVKQVRGYIVDGACRDADLVEETGLAVFCTHFTPSDIVGRWTWDSVEQLIVIGGVTIATGDLVVGDRDGVVIVPAAMEGDVVAEAKVILETESAMRTEILAGMDPKEAYLKHGKF